MTEPRSAGLPNLVIAGVTKAGTTSLFRYLGQHPEIGIADVKEVDYYAPMVHGDAPGPLDEYRAHFRHCVASPWRLEASPRYFIGGPELVRRMVDDLGRPKVLIAIREPVSRMWSSYTYKRSKDRLPEGMRFPEFFEVCRRVAEQGIERHADQASFRTLASGVYVKYLPDWLAGLGNDLRVVFFDHLAEAPDKQLVEICEWLGLDSAPVAGFDLDTRNATYQPRSKALRKAAQKANARLTRVVGDDSVVKRALRGSYQRINAGRLDEQLSGEDRDRVRNFYEPTLPPLRRLLEEHGYRDLPAWLAGADV